jgi:hypothetical protein
MRLHHFGFVGRDLAMMQRRFRSESSEELTGAIADQTQRVYVQFFRDKVSGHVWEIIAPLAGVDGSLHKSGRLIEYVEPRRPGDAL